MTIRCICKNSTVGHLKFGQKLKELTLIVNLGHNHLLLFATSYLVLPTYCFMHVLLQCVVLFVVF